MRQVSPGDRVAIIGSGAAGLGAALALSSRCRIHLFEAAARLGGHCNTVTVDDPVGSLAVDTGFIVFNPVNYPTLCRAFEYLGVASQPSEMSFSISSERGGFEYSGRFPGGLAAQPANLLRPRFWRMVRGIGRFYAEAMADLPALERSGESLGSYLGRRKYTPAFRDDHLAPMAAAIWSQPQGAVEDMPAATLIRFFAAHGLLRISNRPQWRTVTGGSQAYVTRIGQYLVRRQVRLHMGAPVVSVRRGSSSVTVSTASGLHSDFDHVVLAVHGDQALAMLADADAREQEVLGAFAYRPNRVVLHRDHALMPVRRAAWAAWNYIAPQGPQGPQGVTYWMNRLHNIASAEPIFVTLNPPFAPASSRVINEFSYSHPVFDLAAVRAQNHLADLQGSRCTWFCGSYFGYGFHEDAFASGVNAAARMGVPAPWATAAALRPAAE